MAILKAFKGTFKWNFVVALLKAFSGTYKWNFANLKKCQNPEDLRILKLFSDFQNSTFMCLYRPCKLFRLFLFSVCCCAVSMWAPWQEKWRHFASPVKVLKSGIFQIWKKYQNPEIFGILTLFRIFKIPLLSTLKGQSKSSYFSVPEYFLVYVRQAGLIIPLQGLQAWNPNMKHTHTRRSWQPSSLPLVHWKSFLGLGRPD